MNSMYPSEPIRCYSFVSDQALQRIDKAISARFPDISRGFARNLISIGGVWINKKRIHVASKKLSPGDRVDIYIGKHGTKRYYEIAPENILYEDPWIICYRKEPWIPTQGLVCDDYNNLFSALKRFITSRDENDAYLGMHHRLDMETSGVVLFTKSKKINRDIHYQFKNARIQKTYNALIEGIPDFVSLTLTTYIARRNSSYVCTAHGPGKIAITDFTVRKSLSYYSLIEAKPHTGRTHQLRLQLSFIKHPVVGDTRYGSTLANRFPRIMLHAHSLVFFHPAHKKMMKITSPFFDDMEKAANNIPD